MTLSLRSPFSPAPPWAILSTRQPTDCLAIVTRDASFSHGDGYAVFEGLFGRSPGRTKFAKPSSDGVTRFYPR
jgi:hypothetical protein